MVILFAMCIGWGLEGPAFLSWTLLFIQLLFFIVLRCLWFEYVASLPTLVSPGGEKRPFNLRYVCNPRLECLPHPWKPTKTRIKRRLEFSHLNNFLVVKLTALSRCRPLYAVTRQNKSSWFAVMAYTVDPPHGSARLNSKSQKINVISRQFFSPLCWTNLFKPNQY